MFCLRICVNICLVLNFISVWNLNICFSNRLFLVIFFCLIFLNLTSRLFILTRLWIFIYLFRWLCPILWFILFIIFLFDVNNFINYLVTILIKIDHYFFLRITYPTSFHFEIWWCLSKQEKLSQASHRVYSLHIFIKDHYLTWGHLNVKLSTRWI